MFTSQESGLPLFSVVAWWSNTNQAQKKASLRVPREAVGLPYRKHKERRNAVAFSSARYRPVEISYVSLGDRFAAMQIVLVTKRLLRLYSFNQFSFLPFTVLLLM